MTTEAAAFADYISGAAQAAEEPVPEPTIWVFKEGDTFTLHGAFHYTVLQVSKDTILAASFGKFNAGLPISWVLKHATDFARRPLALDEVDEDTVSV